MQPQRSPKINFREIFRVVRFSTFATISARSRHRNASSERVSVLLAAMSRVIGRHVFDPQRPNSECVIPCGHRDGISRPGFGKDMVMRLSSSVVAPSAVAILSTALLCGPSGTAMSQTATGSSTQLPNVTVDPPRQVARPQRPEVTPQGSGRVVHRAGRTSRSTQTATGTPSAARGPVMAKLARLEREASSCNDGCESSFKRGKDPWVGCSESAGYYSVFSATCKDTLTYKSYVDCGETKMFLGWDRQRAWWYCTGMQIGGKFRVTAANRWR